MLTREEAISECKKLWEDIKKSGLSKFDFLYTEAGQKWKVKRYERNCPLCEYSEGCSRCPLVEQYGETCSPLGYRQHGRCSDSWFRAVEGLK